MRDISALLVALLLAGCAGAPTAPTLAGGEGDWWLHGTFSAERTQESLDAWCAVARAYDNECALMESYPEQYRLHFTHRADCEAARGELAAIEHVRPGECQGAP